MKIFPTIPITAVELIVLYFAMKFIAINWILPFMNYEGDVGGVGQILFWSTFLVSAIFYAILTFIAFGKKSITIATLAVFFVLAIVITSTASLPTLLILFVLPLLVFSVHLVITKLLANKKQRSA